MSERVYVTTYFLEMHHATSAALQVPGADVKVVLESDITPDAYRRLYDAVGSPWLWYERSALSDVELGALIGDPAVSIYTLRQSDSIAGYAELRRSPEDEMQLLYFGLVPTFIGKGLGPYFLDWAIHSAFAPGVRRLWVHTCSLDHPRALATYECAGFRLYHQESGWVRIPAEALERQKSHQLGSMGEPSKAGRSRTATDIDPIS